MLANIYIADGLNRQHEIGESVAIFIWNEGKCQPLETGRKSSVLYFHFFSQEHPTAISITAVLVDYETKTGRTMKGVATYWLSHMKPDNGSQYRVPIYVRKSQFRLPFKTNMPVIMIGPGTGLAPFRGFLQERHFLKSDGKDIFMFYFLDQTWKPSVFNIFFRA